jgi:hypothetical protein
MTAKEYDALERVCAARSREFDRLEKAAYEYGAAERLDRPIAAALRGHMRLFATFPKEFPGYLTV